MLRSLGIPARVVGGFQRGEWNPYGRYFMVRLRDAHSWVEVYLDGAGWVSLDPSPRAEATRRPPPAGASLYLDALRLRWYRYVVNWSLRDQVEVATTIRRQADGAWRFDLAALRAWRPPRAALAGAVLVVAGAVFIVWLRRRRGDAAGGARGDGAAPLLRAALRALARQGLRARPGGDRARVRRARGAGSARRGARPRGSDRGLRARALRRREAGRAGAGRAGDGGGVAAPVPRRVTRLTRLSRVC